MSELQAVQESVKAIHWFLGFLATTVGANFAWTWRMKDENSQFKYEVATNYASKEDLREVKEDIIREMHKGFDDLGKRIEKGQSK